MGKPIAGGLIGALSWLDSRDNEDLNRSLEVRSLQRRPWPQIEVILVVGMEQSKVNFKQCYPNGLADPLGVKQLEL